MKILREIRINDELVYKVPAPVTGSADPEQDSEIFFAYQPIQEQHWPLTEEALYKNMELPDLFFEWNENTLVNQENTSYDTSGNLTHLSVDDTQELVRVRDRELRRRMNGIYFWNKGVLEYLTGNNYFFLVYYIIPATGHPSFRKYQRDVFYVIDIAIKDPNILGAYFAKAKKTGLSHVIASLFLNEATTIRDRAFGVMNKTQPDADDLNIVFFWRAYEELPPIMQPHFSHKNNSKVIFGTPTVKFTGTKLSIQKSIEAKRNKPLNTWVYSAPTKLEVKFDGPLMYFIHLDEFPKWKVSQKKIFGKISETVKIQQTIIGKIFITSYPPEEDGLNFEEGKAIYFQSKLSTIREGGLGRTESGLIAHFISALDATDGTFDIYGDADRNLALKFNEAERLQCKDATEMQEKVRQYPRTEEECWRSGGSGSTFDNEHLAEALDYITIREKMGEQLFTDGNLEWSHGKYSTVYMDPVTPAAQTKGIKAKWRFHERYSPQHLNQVGKDSEGMYHPFSGTKFVMAGDPTEYKNKSEVKANPSDWSLTIMSFPDTARNTLMQRTASKVLVAEYLFRHEDPDDDFDEMVKAVFYFGCYILLEANKQWAVTKMKKLGLQKFLLLRQKDGSILPFEEGEANMAVTSTDDTIEEYCRLINIYLRRPKGPGEIDYCKLLKSTRLITNLMRFNPKRTKEFDDVVTFGYALIGMDAFSVLRDRLKKQEKKDEHIAAVFAAITDYI